MRKINTPPPLLLFSAPATAADYRPATARLPRQPAFAVAACRPPVALPNRHDSPLDRLAAWRCRHGVQMTTGRNIDFSQEVLCRLRLWKFRFGKLGRILYHDWGVRLQSTRQGRVIMTEQHESTTAKGIGVGGRIARVATRIAAGLVCIIAAAGLWASDASAQGATPDQAAPKLTAEMCLGCHGQEGFAPATKPEPGSPPPVLKDRFLGSVHGKRQCVECHTNITKIPHEKVEVKVSCVNCHQNLLEQAKDDNKTDQIAKLSGVVDMIGRYMKSIHAQPNKEDQSHTNATCYNCHEAHYIYPKGSPNRNWWRLNLPYDVRRLPHRGTRGLQDLGARQRDVAEWQPESGDLLGLPHHARRAGPLPRQDPAADHQELRQLPRRGIEVLYRDLSRPGQHAGLRLYRQVLRLPRQPRHQAGERSGIERAPEQSPADLPEVPSRRDGRVS